MDLFKPQHFKRRFLDLKNQLFMKAEKFTAPPWRIEDGHAAKTIRGIRSIGKIYRSEDAKLVKVAPEMYFLLKDIHAVLRKETSDVKKYMLVESIDAIMELVNI